MITLTKMTETVLCYRVVFFIYFFFIKYSVIIQTMTENTEEKNKVQLNLLNFTDPYASQTLQCSLCTSPER